MMTLTCSLCQGEQQTYVQGLRSVYSRERTYDIHRCKECGCGMTVPRPSQQELEDVYSHDYDYQAHTLIAGEKRWRAKQIAKYLQRESFENVLDIGCMYGYLLEEMQARSKKATGIELSASIVAKVKEKYNVFCGTVEEYAVSSKESFDLIVAQHVLEHVVDCDPFLNAVYRLLKPGGRFFLCVPFFGSRVQKIFQRCWGWYQVPVHIHHFSPDALKILVGKSGLRYEDTRIRGGDTLSILLTIMYFFNFYSASSRKMSAAKQFIVTLASNVLRPYYFLGDDELGMVFRRPAKED